MFSDNMLMDLDPQSTLSSSAHSGNLNIFTLAKPHEVRWYPFFQPKEHQCGQINVFDSLNVFLRNQMGS